MKQLLFATLLAVIAAAGPVGIDKDTPYFTTREDALSMLSSMKEEYNRARAQYEHLMENCLEKNHGMNSGDYDDLNRDLCRTETHVYEVRVRQLKRKFLKSVAAYKAVAERLRSSRVQQKGSDVLDEIEEQEGPLMTVDQERALEKIRGLQEAHKLAVAKYVEVAMRLEKKRRPEVGSETQEYAEMMQKFAAVENAKKEYEREFSLDGEDEDASLSSSEMEGLWQQELTGKPASLVVRPYEDASERMVERHALSSDEYEKELDGSRFDRQRFGSSDRDFYSAEPLRYGAYVGPRHFTNFGTVRVRPLRSVRTYAQRPSYPTTGLRFN